MSRFLNPLRLFLLSTLILASAGHSAFAQATNGTIAGSVVDASGAAVAGATIVATSLETNAVRTVVSNKVGGYRIESIAPGDYRVDVSAPSFQKTTAPTVVVATSVITSVNVTLKLGTTAATVEVRSDTVSALKTDSGELSETITNFELDNLPISSLNPYALATTLPGVTTVTGQNETNGTSFSVNGNRPRNNNFLIEGVDNNDQGIHGQSFQPENIDAIQEVTFLLDSFSAEYGRGGAVSNVLIKSGSNSFHGAAYERLFNSALDADDKGSILNNVPKTKDRENVFGFRIGGPVVHDRLFFFVSNIWDRYRSTANLGILEVPSAAGYTVLNQYTSNVRVANLLKAYGGLVGVNAKYDTTVALGLDPVTGANRGTVDFQGVQRALGSGQNGRELEATSDLIISEKDKLRFRFINGGLTVPYDVGNFPNQLPGFDTEQTGTGYEAGILYTHIFSPNLINELRPAWSRAGFKFDLRPDTYANPLALSPSISISGITGYGIPAGTVPQGRFQDTYQLEDALTWTKGRHTLKVGFDLEDQRIVDNIPFNFYGSIPYAASKTSSTATNYTALGNYIDNYGGTTTSDASITFGNPTAHPQIWVQSYYAQDSWKVAHNVTVEAGLRYEYNGAPFNYLPYPALNNANPAAFPGGVAEQPDSKNLAPRLGINYSPDGKTVISAGFGMFYSHVFSNLIDNIQGASPNAASKAIYTATSGRGTANWSNILNTITNKTPLATDISNVITPHLLDPVSYEYNLRLQRELPSAFVATVQYVGNRTQHEYATTEFNPILPTGSRLFPTRGRIIRYDNTADSNYNGLQFQLEHKASKGLTLRAAYTYSKLLDDGSEEFTDSSANLSTYAEIQYPATRRREYGASSFDHRHRFVVSAVYQTPTWHPGDGLHWAGAIVNGWEFSGTNSFQSGGPINVEIGYDWNGDGISNDRPVLLTKSAPITNWAIRGDDPIVGFGLPTGTLCDGPRWWATNDPCQVVSAANTHWVTSYFGSTQNTVGRNALFADHTVNTNFSVERSFKTIKEQDLIFRAESFDTFNEGNSGNYNSSLITGVPFNGKDTLGNVYTGAVTFANKPLTVSGGRTLRFYARYQF